MRALVIDDSRAIRLILSRTLQELGFQTLEAANGKEALAVLEREGPVELALVDWNMPEMNGLEFVQAARARPAWGSMRMMMVTTETEMERVVKALEAGADEYVMKPFTREVIAEKLSILGLGTQAA
ncbi:MAG: response regulator [Planctomycetaceae bacterium]|nr:response regulator [Planctomycetaceae bacterium]